jgi:hypothetical protein
MPVVGTNCGNRIKMDIGDTRQIFQYTIGDRYAWRRHASVQNGGRSGNGNIDAVGFCQPGQAGKDSPPRHQEREVF